MKHIGIVGCSVEGAALCFRTIAEEGSRRIAPWMHPEISLHTHPLGDYVPLLDRGDLDGVGELMLSSARKLQASGADFLICPDNTIHQAMDYVLPRSPLPWLHIAEVVAAEAVAKGFRRVAITGTRWLVNSEVYPSKLAAVGIEAVRPSAEDRDEVSSIIMDELVHGIFRYESTARLIGVIARLRQKCDAVVLGCTELPLVLNDANSPIPVLDSTRLLARAALARAM